MGTAEAIKIPVRVWGTWYVRSTKDPRWNKSGRSCGTIFKSAPRELDEWIATCKKELGEPPSDITCGFVRAKDTF